MDSYREIRSMIILALPCPPLPMIACRPLDDESSFVSNTYVVSDSHDLIAHLLNVRAACSQASINIERELLQRRAHDALIGRFDEWVEENQSTPPVEVSYSLFCHFIREYVASFVRSGSLPDLRMPGVSTIGEGHPVRRSAVGFAKAQDIMFGPCTGVGTDIDGMSYQEIIQLSAMRIIASRQDPTHDKLAESPL